MDVTIVTTHDMTTPIQTLYVVQFALWLVTVILWGAAHSGDGNLALPVLTHLVFLGVAAYQLGRPTTIKHQVVFAVGVFVTGVAWAVMSEGHDHAFPIIPAAITHAIALGWALGTLMRLKRIDDAAALEASLPELHPAPHL